MKTIAFASVAAVLGLCACGSTDTSVGSSEVHLPSAAGQPATPEGTLFNFEGTYDDAKHEFSVAYRTADGALVTRSQAAPVGPPTLPYGSAPNEVYFHTNSLSWTPPVLSGVVNGVNRYEGAVTSLTSVIDSTAPTGVTSSSPTYAHGAANGAHAGGTTENVTWSFNNPGGGSFTFKGHATGFPPSPTGIAVVVATDGHHNKAVCTSVCPAGVPLGGQAGTQMGDTARAATLCNGLSSCTFTIQTSNNVDPAVCCWKDYEISWLCNGVKATNSPVTVCDNGVNATCEANGRSVTLTCP